MNRSYDELTSRIDPSLDRPTQMQALVDLLWDEFAPTGISWLGFYLYEGSDELVLGPRRDKPACSPIGLHGACGQAFTQRQAIVVKDVKELGENYIACDPRDRSEIVVPLFDANGLCWGVFDADSHQVGAFSEADAQGLTKLFGAAGLTHSRAK